MPVRTFLPLALVAAALVFMMSILVGTQALSAQGTGAPGATGGGGAEEPHPAHIHSGTCETLGDVVFPLTDVARFDPNASPEASPSLALGSTPVVSPVAASPVASPETGTGDVVAESSTEIAASLDDILATEHAINVHESAENIQNYIACGDLTGPATGGELTVELQELNGSGYMGEAHLLDNGDGTTTVTIYLMVSGAGAGGTPQATPSS